MLIESNGRRYSSEVLHRLTERRLDMWRIGRWEEGRGGALHQFSLMSKLMENV